MSRPRAFSGVDRSRLPHVLLIEDLAVLLRCSVKTVRRRMRSNKFPVAPLPSLDRKLRWSTAAVCDWIDACTASAPAEGAEAGRGS